MVECKLPKLNTRVRFPSSALKLLMRNHILKSLLVLCCAFLAGCATTINPEEEILTDTVLLDAYPEPERVGIYHKVQKGQTLWRIAKAYDLTISDIIRANHIPDEAEIEVNQLILIPGAPEVLEILVKTEEDDSKEFVWPVQGKVVKYFNQLDRGRPIKGIFIDVPPGETVKASRGGRVVFADFLPGYGQTLILDHEDGYYSLYARNVELLVKLGDWVGQKQPIATVGLSQRKSYLHFQIQHNFREENPLFYLK